MRKHISAYLLSSYFKAGVLPLIYSLPATFETFGLYPLLGIPKTVQRAEPRRGKLSTHPVPHAEHQAVSAPVPVLLVKPTMPTA